MNRDKRDKFITLLGAVFIFLSIVSSLLSNHFNNLVGEKAI